MGICLPPYNLTPVVRFGKPQKEPETFFCFNCLKIMEIACIL